jgi:hypothetical protein
VDALAQLEGRLVSALPREDYQFEFVQHLGEGAGCP